MSYAIANIIYGVPADEDVQEAIDGLPADEEGYGTEMEDLGFEAMYSGSASHRPGFCGVRLDTFDECGDFALSTLVLAPTDEQRAQAEAKVAALPEAVRKACQPIDVYVVWSTS